MAFLVLYTFYIFSSVKFFVLFPQGFQKDKKVRSMCSLFKGCINLKKVCLYASSVWYFGGNNGGFRICKKIFPVAGRMPGNKHYYYCYCYYYYYHYYYFYYIVIIIIIIIIIITISLVVGNRPTQDTSQKSQGNFFFVVSINPFFIFFKTWKIINWDFWEVILGRSISRYYHFCTI